MLPPQPVFTQRPEAPGDEAFLRQLMTEVIAQELGAAAWPEPLRSQLLGLQTRTRLEVARNRPAATSRILQAGGVDAGWMLTSRAGGMKDGEIVWLVEIAVAAPFRGCGIGSAALRELLAGGVTVRLHVNRTNTRAIALYTRHGFRPVDSDEIQLLMEYACSPA